MTANQRRLGGAGKMIPLTSGTTTNLPGDGVPRPVAGRERVRSRRVIRRGEAIQGRLGAVMVPGEAGADALLTEELYGRLVEVHS